MEDRGPRVLVMEDDPNLSELYAEALGLEGYQVDSARTIAHARELLQANSYRVFLCDMQIGRDRSTDLLKDILEDSGGMQVIMLSGLGQYQAEAMAMGVDFFLAKPVEIPELVALIDRLAKKPIIPAEDAPSEAPPDAAAPSPPGDAVPDSPLEHRGPEVRPEPYLLEPPSEGETKEADAD